MIRVKATMDHKAREEVWEADEELAVGAALAVAVEEWAVVADKVWAVDVVWEADKAWDAVTVKIDDRVLKLHCYTILVLDGTLLAIHLNSREENLG